MHYLFGFSGRINRAKMWAFLLVAIGWEIALFTVLATCFTWDGFFRSMQSAVEPSAPGAVDWSKVAWPPLNGPLTWFGLAAVIFLIVAYFWASFAVYVKRLHDRNKSAWWLVPYLLLPQALVWGMNFLPQSAFSNPIVAVAGLVVMIGVVVLMFWVFIELYCLRGTDGENQFGPDPLA